MMVFVTERQVKKNFRKAGFKGVDSGVVELVNKAAFNYVRNTLEKALKRHSRAGAIEATHLSQAQKQKGGRVLMPAEYFGVATNHYVEPGAKTFGTDMSVTSDLIRPPFTAVLNGGKGQATFDVPLSSVKNVVAEVLSREKSEVAVRQSAYKELQGSLSEEMAKVVKTLQRRLQKQGEVSKKDLQDVLSMKKYQRLA